MFNIIQQGQYEKEQQRRQQRRQEIKSGDIIIPKREAKGYPKKIQNMLNNIEVIINKTILGKLTVAELQKFCELYDLEDCFGNQKLKADKIINIIRLLRERYTQGDEEQLEEGIQQLSIEDEGEVESIQQGIQQLNIEEAPRRRGTRSRKSRHTNLGGME